MNVVAIGIFGLLGVYSRFALDQFFAKWLEFFPFGVFTINIFGSFLAGLVYVAGSEKFTISPELSRALMIGFCGGFTTFSAYSLQAFLYLESADWARGLSYLLLSPALGLGGACLGVRLARLFIS